MGAEVVKFHPEVVGEGFRFDADEILDTAKGQDFTTVAVLAQNQDGTISIIGNANAGEVLVLMERAKRQIVFGDE